MNWLKIFGQKPKNEFEVLARFDSAEPDAGDAEILMQLQKIGADLTQPREVIHYSYFPTEQAANAIAETLRADSFETDVHAAPEGAALPWSLIARHHMVTNADSVGATGARFTQLAKSQNGEYDGWEAAAKP